MASDLSGLCNLLHFSVKFLILHFFSHLLFEGFSSLVVNDHLLALGISPPGVSLVFLFTLLRKESRDHFLLVFLGIKGLLDNLLVDVHFSKTSFPLFASEFIAVLGFFDLVHSGCIGKVLDLAWRNSSLFFLFLHSFLDCDVLVDTLLLHVFLEPFEAFLLI
jgi:hypothetical protein